MLQIQKIVILSLVIGCYSLYAETIYQVFGGGYDGVAKSSQVVLEKNVELFEEAAIKFDVDIESESTAIFFGAGNDKSIDDIVYTEPNSDSAKTFAARVVKREDCPGCVTRHNKLKNLKGSATKNNFLSEIESLENKTSSDDYHRLYFTGHGHYGETKFGKPDYTTNYIATWHKNLDIQEYATALQKMDPNTSSQTVMVQCFAGGFAQIIFEGGDPKNPLTKSNHCGFFAQVKERPASGCSADITKRKEYSPYFFGAILGKMENGTPVDADFDKDGVVTSKEAHSYVIIKEDSFDIPVTTSSELLRYKTRSLVENMNTSIELDEIMPLLSEDEKQIIIELGKTLKVDLDNAGPLLPFLAKKKSSYHDEEGEVASGYSKSNRRFKSLYTKIYRALRDDEVDFTSVEDVENATRDHASYEDLMSAETDKDEMMELYIMSMQNTALWKRLIYLVETKVMEKALLESDMDDVIEKYNQLITCESEPFFK